MVNRFPDNLKQIEKKNLFTIRSKTMPLYQISKGEVGLITVEFVLEMGIHIPHSGRVCLSVNKKEHGSKKIT